MRCRAGDLEDLAYALSTLRFDLLTMPSVSLIGMKTIWVFGATGLSGRGVARELVDRGADVVLVGRDQNKLAAVSLSVGGSARTRVVSGLPELARLLHVEKPGVVVNAVGPYSATSLPLARSSLPPGAPSVAQPQKF